MSIDIPTAADLADLSQHRNQASVSIYVSAAATGAGGNGTPHPEIVHDVEAAQLALRTAIQDAGKELSAIGVSKADCERITEYVRELERNRDFWGTQARSIAVFVSPEGLRAFRIMSQLDSLTAVGDRFDMGPLVRATTFAHRGYVLALEEDNVRLLFLDSHARASEIELTTLPADASDVLEVHVTTGRMDRARADGTLGPKVQQRRYCTIVQDAVLHEINGRAEGNVPLVLATGSELESAYREVNTYDGLLVKGINNIAGSWMNAELEERARVILDKHYAQILADWRELFGTREAQERASSNLEIVAKAATAGQVGELLFNINTNDEGTIDEFGVITFVPEPGPTTYRVVDEIAARVLRTGGTVKAVREEDLPSDSPVAATLRAPVPEIAAI